MGKIRVNIFIITTILAMLVITGAPCYGQIIYACVNKNNGDLRIVQNPTHCKASEGPVSLLTTSGLYGTGCQNAYTCSCLSNDDILLSAGAECSDARQHLVASNFSVWFKTWYAECAYEDPTTPKNYIPIEPLLIDILCMKP